MKLAEALIERADLQRHLAQLQARLLQNAQYQEGESPAEDPVALLDEYRRANEALHRLIVQITLPTSAPCWRTARVWWPRWPNANA